ncbi:MAG: PVC-type heme-binding CxxCH protein, partial [Planctomycetaceae bacterium]
GLTHSMSVVVKPLWLDVKSQKSKVKGQKRLAATRRGARLSVYVATRRDIFLYHDDNGDLKADRRQQIIKLKTKGDYPHNGLAGIAFDAMGWMYFGLGENLGADYTVIGSDGTKLSGGGEGGNLYRCRPDGSKLTKWATGFWNPHASCVDAFGRVFTVDNDPDSRPPCRLLHIIEGGDYGFRFRNGRKGLHPFTAWNGEIPGTLPMVAGTGEAPSGIVTYESDGLPKEYIGNLLVTSWGDHRIDRFVLKPKGASFVSRAETLIQGGEEFRPVGLAVAPDGSLFCTDWVKRDYKLHGHGRIWRISRKKKTEPGSANPRQRRKNVIDLSTITSKRPVKELTKLLSHPRLGVRRMAANVIAADHRKAGRKWDRFSVFVYVPKERRREFHEWAMAWHIPMIFRSSGVDPDNLRKGRKFVDWLFRRKFRIASDPFLFRQYMNYSIVYNASDKQLVAEFKNANANTKLKVLPELQVERIRLACMIGGRENSPKNPTLPKLALKTDNITLLRIAVQWVAEEKLTKLTPQVAAVLNGKVMNTDLFLATLAALEMLDGKPPKDFDKTPAGKYVLPLVKDAKRPAAVRAQALRLVNPDDMALDAKLFGNLLASRDASLRTEAVRSLQLSSRTFAAKLLAGIAVDKKSPVQMRADAVAGLSGRSFDDPQTLRTLIGLTASRDSSIRIEAVRSFRPLLMKTAFGRPVRIRIVREIGAALRKDPQVFRKNGSLLRIAELLAAGYREAGIALPPELRVVSKLRPRSVADWYLSAKPRAAGDAAVGRRVFFATNGATCYRCHTVNGRGGKIGPDLSTIARTANRHKLAQSILEPSKEIAPQFTLWSFVMTSGKVHHGMILGDTRDNKQRIGTAEGKVVELPADKIELRRPQNKSVMPDKLIDRLTATEFRDLLAFLESLK